MQFPSGYHAISAALLVGVAVASCNFRQHIYNHPGDVTSKSLETIAVAASKADCKTSFTETPYGKKLVADCKDGMVLFSLYPSSSPKSVYISCDRGSEERCNEIEGRIRTEQEGKTEKLEGAKELPAQPLATPPPPAPSPPPPPPPCTKNTDCQGTKVCDTPSGQCVEPAPSGSGAVPAPPPPAGSAQ